MLKTCFPMHQKCLWTVETKPEKPLPTSEYVANFLTGRVYQQTFANDIFFSLPQKLARQFFKMYLSHKIQANFLTYTNK